jgi:hypothetical protein
VGTVGQVEGPDERISDDELAALALAADPDAPVPADAVPLQPTDAAGDPLLPSWYMPSPSGGVGAQPGWRRRVGIVIVVAFLLINAAGLCSTYGPPFGI